MGLQNIEQQTYLGFNLMLTFSWDSRVSNVCKMWYYNHILLSHIARFDILKLLIESLVFLQYAIQYLCGDHHLKQNLAKCLECLQNHAVHLLFYLQKFGHITEYYHRVESYHFQKCFILIQFGWLTDYHTSTKDFFHTL